MYKSIQLLFTKAT